MRTRRINNLDQWKMLYFTLKENKYKLWQMQYNYNSLYGFHALFCKAEQKYVEIITFNKDVQDAIVKNT